MNPSDLDLLQAYLDGDLTDAEAQALNARLKTEPRLAEQLMLLARDEATLTEWARADIVAAGVCAEAGAPSLNGASARSTRRILPLSIRRRVVRVVLVGAVAAAVVLAVGLLFWKPSKPVEKDNVLARLDEVQGEVYLLAPSGEWVEVEVGELLTAGQEIRTGSDGSFAVLRYADDTLIELSTLTRVRLDPDGGAEAKDAGKRLFLAEGVVNAAVARQPEGRPMVLTTPHAVIRVLGTRFSSAALTEATRVELEEGRVRMTRTSDGQSIEVEEGSYAVAAAKVEPAPPQVEQFTPRLLPPRITRPSRELPGGPGPTMSVAISPNGKILAVGGWDGTVTLWDWDAKEIRLVLKSHTRQVRSLAFAPNGKYLAAAGADKLTVVWDLESNKELLRLEKQRQEVEALAFAPDSRTLAVSAGFIKNKEVAHQVKLWDVTEGQLKATLSNHPAPVYCLAFSPDGSKTLAAGCKDGTIKLWDAEHKELAALPGHDDAVTSLAFSPNGDRLVSASRDSTLRTWDARAPALLRTFRGHTREVRQVVFSPDGQLLASCASDASARLWDVRTGQETTTVKAHKNTVTGVAFASDGQSLVTCGWDKLVKIWTLAENIALLPARE